MKNTKLLLAIATSAALLTGCQNTHGIDTNMAISSGLNAYKAATLSDADAKRLPIRAVPKWTAAIKSQVNPASTVNVWQNRQSIG